MTGDRVRGVWRGTACRLKPRQKRGTLAARRTGRALSLTTFLFTALLLTPGVARAQQFVEYPAHPASYGDHAVAATWTGGPSTVTVTFLSDEAILHEDGNGQSQRTARNTLNYTPPASPANPQDYDDLRIVAVYGPRLPLLQEMAASGTCTLRYAFATPVTTGFDLFLTDIDTDDAVVVTAWSAGGAPLDLSGWTQRARGDLSVYKNTGTGYSAVVAPDPVVTFGPGSITLTAADGQNYNRSVTILTAPPGAAIGWIDITFTGVQNSASRAEAGTGSHVYVGVSTIPATTDVPESSASDIRLLSPRLSRSGDVLLDIALDREAHVTWTIFDARGRIVARPADHQLLSGRRTLRWDGADRAGLRAPAGVYFLRVERDGAPRAWTDRVTLLR